MARDISVYSDVICPWCLLGKVRLEAALDELGLRDGVTVSWLPFELNPDMPEGGMARRDYRAAKFGPERSATLDAEMTARGLAEGVRFAFERIERTPNTRNAHRLIALASRAGRGDGAVTALFRAYFEDGRDIGAGDTLLAIGSELGLDRADVEIALSDPALSQEIVALETRAARIGITGVPFFIVDGRWAVSGAQPREEWHRLLRDETLRPDAA